MRWFFLTLHTLGILFLILQAEVTLLYYDIVIIDHFLS